MTGRRHGSSIVVAYVCLARMATVLSRCRRPYPAAPLVAVELRRFRRGSSTRRLTNPPSDRPSFHRHWVGRADEPSEPSQ